MLTITLTKLFPQPFPNHQTHPENEYLKENQPKPKNDTIAPKQSRQVQRLRYKTPDKRKGFSK